MENSKNENRTGLTQPFEKNTLGCERYRIPAIITLNDGSILAAADMRHSHGQDAPQNLDTLTAHSSDGGKSWQYNKVNHFDDCADGTQSRESASYNDSALIQSQKTGRIFIVASAFPSGCGAFKSAKGTGFIGDGKGEKRLAVTDKKGSTNISDYKYFVGDFEGDYAKICGAEGYTVDRELNIYLKNEPVYTEQINSGKKVQQNLFFTSSDFHIFPTCYLVMRYSDDNAKTWSAPVILNPFVKRETETFFGICPGRGFVCEAGGRERIIFCAYSLRHARECTATVYSDDGGLTWQRGSHLSHSMGLRKSSESQIIAMPDGRLRIFSRTWAHFAATAESRDGGISWTKLKADKELYCTKNCMLSFIALSKKIDGKTVVAGSFACGGNKRENGVIRLGLADNDGSIEWKSTLRLNSGFFAYSCLTETSFGLLCLFEDEPAHITLRAFDVEDDCTLTPQDGVYFDK